MSNSGLRGFAASVGAALAMSSMPAVPVESVSEQSSGDHVIQLAQAGKQTKCPPATCMTNEDRRNLLRRDIEEIRTARKNKIGYDTDKYERLVTVSTPTRKESNFPNLVLLGAHFSDEVALVYVDKDAAHEQVMSRALSRFAREWNIAYPSSLIDGLMVVYPGTGGERDSKGQSIKDIAGTPIGNMSGPEAHGAVAVMFNGVFKIHDTSGNQLRLSVERDEFGPKLTPDSMRLLTQQVRQTREGFELFLKRNPGFKANGAIQSGKAGSGGGTADSASSANVALPSVSVG